jgi:hypothetical protein
VRGGAHDSVERVEPGLLPKDAAIPVGATSVALMAWRHRSVLRVTVIAKATFSIACDTAMPRTRPQKIITQEVHHGNMPSHSVRLTTDLAPYLERADVLFTGSAYAPPGATLESMHVRLGVYDGGRALLDKALLVRKAGGFREVPLVYDRAYGGIGWADNPFGVGVDGGAEPSILDPEEPTRTVGFGPISQSLPSRKKLLRGARRALVGDVPTLADDIAWEYFQAAPRDQRIDWLRGDEWIVLDGLHPSLPSARTRLPGARGLARVHGLDRFGVADGQPLDLHADTLRIDGDDRQVTVTFRGVFPVADEAALSAVSVVAGIEMPGAPIAWPTVLPPRAPVVRTEPAMPPARARMGTMVLEDPQGGIGRHTIADGGQSRGRMPTLPFSAVPFASPLAESTGAPPEARWSGTLELAPEQDAAAAHRDATPFHHDPPTAPIEAEPSEPEATTLAIRVQERPPPAAPEPSEPEAETVAIRVRPRAEPEPPRAPEREVSVGVAPPKEAAPPPAPPRPAPQVKPAAPPPLKKGLYGKFGQKR